MDESEMHAALRLAAMLVLQDSALVMDRNGLMPVLLVCMNVDATAMHVIPCGPIGDELSKRLLQKLGELIAAGRVIDPAVPAAKVAPEDN